MNIEQNEYEKLTSTHDKFYEVKNLFERSTSIIEKSKYSGSYTQRTEDYRMGLALQERAVKILLGIEE